MINISSLSVSAWKDTHTHMDRLQYNTTCMAVTSALEGLSAWLVLSLPRQYSSSSTCMAGKTRLLTDNLHKCICRLQNVLTPTTTQSKCAHHDSDMLLCTQAATKPDGEPLTATQLNTVCRLSTHKLQW